MVYNAIIKSEAAHAIGLGQDATEDKFHGLYNGILNHWFPTSSGYIIEPQVMLDGGKPEFIVIKHLTGGVRNPVLIVELKRPNTYNDAGKQRVKNELREYIEGRFDSTTYGRIYGLGGIGAHWMTCEMVKTGGPNPTMLQDWHDDISSDASFALFQQFVTTHITTIH